MRISSSINDGAYITPPLPDFASGAPEMRHFSDEFNANEAWKW
jgi:hypothetical protein